MIIKDTTIRKITLLTVSGALTGALQVWLNIPWLIFINLVPLFFYVYRSDSEKAFLRTVTEFLVPYYFVQSVFLITVAKIMPLSNFISIPLAILAVFALTAWLTLIMLVPMWFFPHLRKHNCIDLLTFSLLFVVGEWLAEYVPILSFPWSGLWLAVVSNPTLTQSASLLGCHFTSLLILLSCSALTLALCSYKTKKAIGYSLVLVALLSANIAYGTTHISHLKASSYNQPSTKIMTAQDNVEGRDKSKLLSTDAVSSYMSIMENNWQDNIDLVLLPETAVPCSYEEKSDTFKPLSDFAEKHNTTLLTGCFVKCGDKTYNAMYSVTKDGFCESPYLKQVLVPFGEQIPLANLWGASTLSCAKPWTNKQLLTVGDTKIASIICIESIYPSLVRKQMLKGGELLCVSTNDSWFGKSYAKSAHYRHTIIRAVESGKYTIRSGNCGISAVITPWGEQTAAISNAEKAAIVTDVKALKSKTLYTHLGDVVILPGCVMILLVVIKKLKTKCLKNSA